MAHNAKITCPDGIFHFASIDGDLWLGVNQPVVGSEAEAWLADVMENGTPGGLPLKCTTNWLKQSVAHLYDGGTIEFT